MSSLWMEPLLTPRSSYPGTVRFFSGVRKRLCGLVLRWLRCVISQKRRETLFNQSVWALCLLDQSGAKLKQLTFPALASGYMFSRPRQRLHVFSPLSQVICWLWSWLAYDDICCHSHWFNNNFFYDGNRSNTKVFSLGKYLSTSLMLSDTDDDSDAESTVFEVKKRSMNGSVNGYIRKDTWYRMHTGIPKYHSLLLPVSDLQCFTWTIPVWQGQRW